MVSTLDSSHSIDIPSNSWTVNGSGNGATVSFDALLYTGSYKLLVSTTPYGYLLFSNTVDVTFPINVLTNVQQTSFNGGRFSIAASYLSPVSYITVNNYKGFAISSSNS